MRPAHERHLQDLLDRIDVMACALSDHDGTGRLEVVNPRNYGAHEIAEPGQSRPDLDFVEVSLRTLDALEEEGRIVLDDVGLAWLDVQGHEPRVLSGPNAYWPVAFLPSRSSIPKC